MMNERETMGKAEEMVDLNPRVEYEMSRQPRRDWIWKGEMFRSISDLFICRMASVSMPVVCSHHEQDV